MLKVDNVFNSVVESTQDLCQFGQQFLRSDDQFGLHLLDAVSHSVGAQVGVEGDYGEFVLEAGNRTHQPLAACVGVNDDLVFGL